MSRGGVNVGNLLLYFSCHPTPPAFAALRLLCRATLPLQGRVEPAARARTAPTSRFVETASIFHFPQERIRDPIPLPPMAPVGVVAAFLDDHQPRSGDRLVQILGLVERDGGVVAGADDQRGIADLVQVGGAVVLER